VRGKWNTTYYTVAFEAGGVWAPWEGATVRPFAGLRHARLNLSNHDERGPSPLIIDDFSDSSAQAILGVRAGQGFKVFGRGVALDLTLARKQSIRKTRTELDTHFYDAPDTPVRLRSDDYARTLDAAGVSLRVALTRNTVAGAAFDYEGGSGRTRKTVSGMVGCSW